VVDVVIGDIAPPPAPETVMAMTGRHQAGLRKREETGESGHG
jgi:hypothetical protein